MQIFVGKSAFAGFAPFAFLRAMRLTRLHRAKRRRARPSSIGGAQGNFAEMQGAIDKPDPSLSHEICRTIVAPFHDEREFAGALIEAPAPPIIAIRLERPPRDAEAAIGMELQFSNVQRHAALMFRLAPLTHERMARNRRRRRAGAEKRNGHDQGAAPNVSVKSVPHESSPRSRDRKMPHSRVELTKHWRGPVNATWRSHRANLVLQAAALAPMLIVNGVARVKLGGEAT